MNNKAEIKNISFIIIARNEEFAVKKCVQSIAAMSLEDCEVICVDSDSTDNTLSVMKAFTNKIAILTLLKCSGYVNAAVARNAGLQYATKDYIYFVDGDVELFPEFIIKALDRIKSGRADAVTGKLQEIQYTPDYQKQIRTVTRRNFQEEKPAQATGGIFLTRKDIIDKHGTFDTNFVRLQDFDYTLRISRHGTLLQLPEFIGIHHTQEFHNRSWEIFRKGYSRLYGALFRRHWNHPRGIWFLLRGNRGLATFLLINATLLITLAGTVLDILSWWAFPGLLAMCLIADLIYSVGIKRIRVSQWVLHNYLEPTQIIAGMLNPPIFVNGSTQVEKMQG